MFQNINCFKSFVHSTVQCTVYNVRTQQRIIDDRIEKYSADIVIISK